MTSTVIIRTDSRLKAKAQKVAGDLGLTLTAVMNNYLEDFVQRKSVSFNDPYGSMPGEPITEMEIKSVSKSWMQKINKIG